MLADPLVLGGFSSTIPTYTVGTPATFRKVANGKATAVDGPFSVDQPAYLTVKQRPSQTPRGARSDFSMRFEQHFNVSPINGVPQADIPMVLEVRVISYPQFHTAANIASALNVVSAAVHNAIPRLQSGEGI